MTDFIATTFIDFPVFNIADIGITVGVVIALIGFMFLSPAARDHEADDVRKAGRSPSMAADLHILVDDANEGTRLDAYLGAQDACPSRSACARLIELAPSR